MAHRRYCIWEMVERQHRELSVCSNLDASSLGNVGPPLLVVFGNKKNICLNPILHRKGSLKIFRVSFKSLNAIVRVKNEVTKMVFKTTHTITISLYSCNATVFFEMNGQQFLRPFWFTFLLSFLFCRTHAYTQEAEDCWDQGSFDCGGLGVPGLQHHSLSHL